MPFNPNLVPLVFVTSALGSLTTAPMGYIILGIGGNAQEQEEGKAEGKRSESPLQVVLYVIAGLRKNLLVLSCVAGAVYNLIFGNDFPAVMADIIDTLAMPFAPLVFFLAGMSSVGSFGSFGTLAGITVPTLLVTLKSLVLALITYYLVVQMGGTTEQQDYAFVYSLMPTATSLLVVAKGYGFDEGTLAMLSASLMLSKVVGFILLFVSAAILTIGDNDAELHTLANAERHAMRLASFLGTALILLSTTRIRAWRRDPLRRLLVLVGLQFGLACSCLIGELTYPFLAARARLVLFALISTLRWGADGWTLMLQVNRFVRASYRGADMIDLGLGDDETFEKWFDPINVDLSHGFRVACAFALACAMTVPWTLVSGGAPPADALLPFWVPYGKNQQLVYAGAYAALALSLAVLVTLAGRRRAEQVRLVLGAGATGGGLARHDAYAAERGVLTGADSAVELGAKAQGNLPFQFLIVTLVLRCVLYAAVCMLLASGNALTGTAAQLVLVVSLLSDGQGAISLLLFGLRPELLTELKGIILSLSGSVAYQALCCTKTFSGLSGSGDLSPFQVLPGGAVLSSAPLGRAAPLNGVGEQQDKSHSSMSGASRFSVDRLSVSGGDEQLSDASPLSSRRTELSAKKQAALVA